MRALYLSPHVPGSTSSGGAQRTQLLRDALNSFCATEHVFLTPDRFDNPVSSGQSSVKKDDSGARLARNNSVTKRSSRSNFLSSFIHAGRPRWYPCDQLISEIGDLKSYDLVVARYLSSACLLDAFRHPRLIIDVDDYDPDRLRQRIASSGWLKRLTLKRCLRYSEAAHRILLPRAAHCWVSNPADRRHPGLATATVLPNIPYFPAGLPQFLPPPPIKGPPIFLIVGTLSYSANSDGIDAFLREAWLALRNQAPDVELDIVGQGMSLSQRKRWGRFPGVKPIGFVESLSESYARCVATLAPILAGGGTNIKVLESSAYGRPCVVSRVAHRGFEETLPDGLACLRAERISDMAGVCLRLIREPDLARRIGGAARHAIEHYYTTDKFGAAVREGCAFTRGTNTL